MVVSFKIKDERFCPVVRKSDPFSNKKWEKVILKNKGVDQELIDVDPKNNDFDPKNNDVDPKNKRVTNRDRRWSQEQRRWSQDQELFDVDPKVSIKSWSTLIPRTTTLIPRTNVSQIFFDVRKNWSMLILKNPLCTKAPIEQKKAWSMLFCVTLVLLHNRIFNGQESTYLFYVTGQTRHLCPGWT
jgi:hypothetical protein